MTRFAGIGAEDLLIPVVRSDGPVGRLRQPCDAIAPVAIEHACDQAIDEDGALEYEYNHLVYRFDGGHGEIRARSYLDDIGTVDLFLPEGIGEEHPEVQRILYYLSRRFRRIRGHGPDGYRTIWPPPSTDSIS